MLDFLLSLTYWHWFGFAAFLLIIELLITNTGFLLWIAISATLVGLVLCIFQGLSWPYQLLIFAATSLFYAVAGKKYLQRHPICSDKPTLNKRCEQYFGREFFLQTAIENGRGTIYVDDSTWRVAGPELPVGAKVKVVGADGIILQVVAVE